MSATYYSATGNMAEMNDAYTRIHDHERRITKVESDVGQMAPKIHVMEEVGRLRQDMVAFKQVVEYSVKSTEQNVSKLASDMKEIMSRQGELNEEMMRNAAAAQQEQNAAANALAAEKLKQATAETERLRQAAEDAKIVNRIKNYWLPIMAIVVSGSTAAVTVWKILTWVGANLK